MSKLLKVLSGIILISCSMDVDKLPDRYAGQITQEEYEMIVEYSRNFLQEHGTINKIEDGIIYVDLNRDVDNVNQLALDNLIRYCKQEEDKAKWQGIINDHFERLTAKVDFDKSDFDHCREFLSLRIYPEYDDEIKEVMTYKVDFPGTITALVLNLPDKYESLDKEIVDSWNLPIDSLFYLAQENVNKNEIEIVEKRDAETQKIYAFFSTDQSASFIRDIETNAAFGLGEFGAFVAIPTTGSAFVAPLDNKNSLSVLNRLGPMVANFFEEDPGNITSDIYWYFDGKFKVLSRSNDAFEIPSELLTRF